MRGTLSIGTPEPEIDKLGLMAEIDPLAHLEAKRAATWKELAKREPELIRQIERWDEAIAALKKVPGEFSSYRSGADAVAAYLRKNGPTAIREVCKQVAAGGWASDHPDAYWKLWDAIQYQLERSQDPKIISLSDDMIGLPEHKKKR